MDGRAVAGRHPQGRGAARLPGGHRPPGAPRGARRSALARATTRERRARRSDARSRRSNSGARRSLAVVGRRLRRARSDGVELDVSRFRRLLADGRADEAVGALPWRSSSKASGCATAPTSITGRLAEGQSLRRELGDRARARGRWSGPRPADLEAAIEHARRRLELDPLAESGHRLLMLLYAWAGERARRDRAVPGLRPHPAPRARRRPARGDDGALRADQRREARPAGGPRRAGRATGRCRRR